MMKIYNTLNRKIEEFRAIDPPKVGMYSCGPTVYDYSHIGHFRTYVGTDLLRRTLEYFGNEVKQVMNITDVGHLVSDSDSGEDKMEKGAKREKKTVWEIAEFYTKDFFEALEKLNIEKPTIISKATNNIPEMISFIEKLEKKGFTYKTDDGVYFDSSKLSDYGRLTGQKLDELKAGARVEMVKGKKHPSDFALWKNSFSPRQMEWDSPWAKGFPGWHIECSAMSAKYLGDNFDIHTGGIDHIPIHHTNEIAQSEGATGKIPASYWIHFNFLMVNEQKMSKSLENIYNQHDLEEKGFSLMDARYLFLTCHYQDVLNFTWESLAGAKEAYKNLNSLVLNLAKTSQERTALSEEKLKKIADFRNRFDQALENNLAIPEALSILWQAAKSNIPSGDKRELILDFDKVFGLRLGEVGENVVVVPLEITALAKKRDQLRGEKMWKEADQIRMLIEERGFLVEDNDSESRIVKK